MGVNKGQQTKKEQTEDTKLLVFEKYRLETFKKNWKKIKGFKYCTPKNFAAAGFYNCYTNKCPDNVKCFSCQKELGDWEKEDDPWEEHLKRGNQCPFVLFQSKQITTFKDFFELLFEIEKIKLHHYFEKQHNALMEKEQFLLKKFEKFKTKS